MKNIAHTVIDKLLECMIIHSKKLKLICQITYLLLLHLRHGHKTFHELIQDQFVHCFVFLESNETYFGSYPHDFVFYQTCSLNLMLLHRRKFLLLPYFVFVDEIDLLKL